jgi:hypothetical protein
MKTYLYGLAVLLCGFFMLNCNEVAAQEQEPLDLILLAEEEADKYQRLLDLEDWQTFYVDSTLKANFAQLQIDLEKLQKAKVTNLSLYQDAKDRCWDEIDRNFKKWFTEKQWAAYLKSGAAKLQKQRAKRKGQK